MNTKMIKNIIWEKWRDPFLGYDENEIDIDSPKYTDIDEDENYDDEIRPKDPIKAIATPMGFIPYNEYTASSKIFNFWVGHTNFNITNSIAYLIENTDGVETLDIFTRYRFRIGIGKAFESRDTMKLIEERIVS